ncbi:cobalt-precorrin-5B (C(1))-methyltransferase [Sphaerisporangium album]|uniref:Cobalt-precorrin-5B C(1)-methyltransferase n=1 Tax=Sphaerisporangium album TaxID=509200 RepID=A0A367EXQ4_9ACTN|nr:cobalt-precorrin-5B (C(1))-methyltransferase [Sphaerisporangium album]RCG22781.1 cobalt-precorrin-5B (C(1))-methyltransferase [Sphaerisporangium album]
MTTGLRYGWTTGACATAATTAAYTALLTGSFPDPVEILLPRGQRPAFALAVEELVEGPPGEAWARAGVVKDAGDDPDVTHGALITATVRHGAPGTGVTFRAGPGVGTVTKPGLPLDVGEPAINPVPRQMMRDHLARVAGDGPGPVVYGPGPVVHGDGSVVDGRGPLVDGDGPVVHGRGPIVGGHGPDVIVEISVENGEELARRTWNPRLGILGGLSILGTTGIVVPYSCSAWIDSIRRGIDVARAAGHRHVAACTGSTSERVAAELYGLPEDALLDMGDFAGAVLKYLRRHPVPRLTVAGGIGKLSKLADGHLDLHSGRSQVSTEALATMARDAGGDEALAGRVLHANTALQALTICQEAGLPLGDLVAGAARAKSLDVLRGAPVAVDVIVIDRAGTIVGRAG